MRLELFAVRLRASYLPCQHGGVLLCFAPQSACCSLPSPPSLMVRFRGLAALQVSDLQAANPILPKPS